jgi:predicted DNA-binding transcriptional regulator YafY
MTEIQDTIRNAAEQHRRVLVRFHSFSGIEYEREMEPYVLGETDLLGFEYLRNEYRTLALSRIISAEITPREFVPRREIEINV